MTFLSGGFREDFRPKVNKNLPIIIRCVSEGSTSGPSLTFRVGILSPAARLVDINLNGYWSLTDNIVFHSAPTSSSSDNSAAGDGTDNSDGNYHANALAVTISHTVGGNRTTTRTVATNGTHDYHIDLAVHSYLAVHSL